MREIKFRGKQIFEGDISVLNKWVYGHYYEQLVGNRVHFKIMDKYGYSFKVLPETVGQYTGLKDCEEIELYEFDFVDICGVIYLIIFDPNTASFVLDNMKGNKQGYLHFNPYSMNKVKKVGSRLENPELLEEIH